MAQQQQQKNQDKRPTIEILYDAPVRQEDVWSLNVWVVVKGGQSQANRTIILHCDGIARQQAYMIQPDGRTEPIPIIVPANKNWTEIEVAIEGTSLYQKKQITITQPSIASLRHADEWSMLVVGSQGAYTVYVSITEQNRLPLKGIKVRVYDDRHNKKIGEQVTDEFGSVEIPVPEFKEAVKNIVVEAVSTRIPVRKVRLYQRANNKPPAVPEPPDTIQTISEAIKSGYTCGQEALHKQRNP